MNLEKDEQFARHVLEKLLRNEPLSQYEIGALVSQRQEHAYLDFKDGKATVDKGKFRNTLREYVAAFANADGGILCVGPQDKIDATGCRSCSPLSQPSMERSIAEWVRDVIADLIPYLSPLPRISMQKHVGNGTESDVLLVAVARAPGLVPLYGRTKRPSWFVRFHDGNRELPDYLAADIILGRRNRPILALRAAPRVSASPPSISGDTSGMEQRAALIGIGVTVDNLGFNSAEGVQVGLISWSLGRKSEMCEFKETMRQYVEIIGVEGAFFEWSAGPHLVHAMTNFRDASGITLPAWQHRSLSFEGGYHDILELYLPVAKGGATEVNAAVYLLANGCAPQWYQLQYVVRELGKNYFQFEPGDPTLTYLHFERPKISLTQVRNG